MLAAPLLIDLGLAARADPAGLAARQQRRLAALLDVARTGAFYGAALKGRPSAQWPLAELPVMDKRQLMRRFADIVTDARLTPAALREFMRRPEAAGQPFLGRYWVWESSGSTGEPGLYVHDDAALDLYDALEAVRRDTPRPWARWFDPFYLGERISFVGATGGHFASHVAMQRLRRAWPWATRQWHGLSILQPLPDLVTALEALRPTILATYPTAAAVLAGEARAGRLRLRLQEVWTGGETLTPAVRSLVEQAFGCTLRNSYGASEFLPIAWECGHGRLHVNADWVLLEAVDVHGRAVPAGTLSHTTLVTNLANHVLPVIRFDLGDRIVLPAERCPCGSALPVLEVQGRRDDTLVVPGRGGRDVPLLPLALSTVLEEEAGAFDFQLQQTAPDALRLCLGPRAARSGPARQRCRRALADFASGQGAAALRITTAALPQLPLGRTGKLKRIVALPAARRPGAQTPAAAEPRPG